MSSDVSRRAFAEALALAAVTPWLGGALPPGPVPQPWPAEAPGLEAVARALTEAVRVQYGERLDNDTLAAVGRQILAALQRAERVRAVPLSDGDEPDIVFSVAPADRP